MAQLLMCLVCMNKAYLVHCDLKPQNILMSAAIGTFFSVVLADFGSAAYTTITRGVGVGTVYYMCPEQHTAQYKPDSKPGRPASIDVWALGVILADLFCGRQFANMMLSPAIDLGNDAKLRTFHEQQIFPSLVEDLLDTFAGEEFTEKWRAVIRKCLTYDAGKRPAPQQLLEHFMTDPVFAPERAALLDAGIKLPDPELVCFSDSLSLV